MTGHTEWYIPDMFFPATGTPGEYVSHESICVLNTGEADAELRITLYFEDRPPMSEFRAVCGAQRTHHVRMDKLLDASGQPVPKGVPYAGRVVSNVPVMVQYSRVDTTQSAMSFMTTIAAH